MLSEIDFGTLNAFLDGELPAVEIERVTALLAKNPDLQAWVLQQETLRSQIQEVFGEIAQVSAPDRLIRAVRTTRVSYRWRLRRVLAANSFRALLPAAATLVAGLVIGMNLRPMEDLNVSGGALMAKGALATALNNQLASIGSNGRVRIGISFRNHAGQDCRTFVDSNQAGLACHHGEGWVVAALVAASPETGGTYRMAGSEIPDAIRHVVTSDIEGAPFDAAAEKAARDRGWR